MKIIVAQMTNVDVKIVFWIITQAIDNELWMDEFNNVKLQFKQFLITGGIRSMIKWVYIYIYIFFFWYTWFLSTPL